MTKKLAERIMSLIERADALDELANQVQDERSSDPKLLLHQLRTNYGMWYAEALAIISDDPKEAFQKEYEGSFTSSKIKTFLQSGLDLNVIFAELAAQGAIPKWLYPVDTAFHGPLQEQKQILRNVAALVGNEGGLADTFDALEGIFRNLPHALAALRQEVHGRPGLVVNDEYDLQRIVHAALCLHHRDVRPEEYGPSRAGARPRIDFLLKEERIAVETKMTRANLGPRQLGDELAQDILRYQRHPEADGYFALIYDPTHRVINSHGFESDFPQEAALPARIVIVH